MAAKKGGRRRRIRVIVVTAAIVVVAVAGYFAYRTSHSTASAAIKYTTEAAQKMTLTSSVSETGNMVLGSSATVSPSVSGTVSGLAVKVGDPVTKGQVLFTLVNPQLDIAVEDAQNSYNQAVNSLSQAKLSVLQAKKSLSDLETQKADQTASAAEVASATETASATQTASVLLAAGAAEATPATLTEASFGVATLNAADSSSTTGSTTDSTTDSTEGSTTSSSSTTESTSTTTLPSSTSTTQSATGNTTDNTTGNTTGNTTTTVKAITTLDIEMAAQQVTTAELGVASAETQIESAKLALQQAEDNAAAREVTAPIDGTVTTLSISNGDTLGGSSSSNSAATGSSTGSSTSSSSSTDSTMVITDPSSIEATVTLAEADVVNVKVGDKATFTFDALPDLTLTGKVASLDTTGIVSQGVVSYTATIVPDVPNDSVKSGMTVTADIITNVTPDALVVPSTAVKSDSSGGNYVQILTNGSPVSQTVVVGTSNDTYTQITSGLTVGQKVVTATTSSSAKTTGTTTKSNGSSLLNSGGLTGSGGAPAGGGSPPSGTPPAGN